MEGKIDQLKTPAMLVLIILHVVGIIGFQLSWTKGWFPELTPFHLIISTAIVLIFQKEWNALFITWSILTFSVGLTVEIIGVQSGQPFGSYMYGDILGPKILQTPIMIGINWLLIAYITGSSVSYLSINKWLKVFLAAGLMVLLDLIIEPFAIKYALWEWTNHDIPLQNYISWFAIGLLMQSGFQFLTFVKQNPLSPVLLLIQVLFFLLLN